MLDYVNWHEVVLLLLDKIYKYKYINIKEINIISCRDCPTPRKFYC